MHSASFGTFPVPALLPEVGIITPYEGQRARPQGFWRWLLILAVNVSEGPTIFD